jgi:hypothetical protein
MTGARRQDGDVAGRNSISRPLSPPKRTLARPRATPSPSWIIE